MPIRDSEDARAAMQMHAALLRQAGVFLDLANQLSGSMTDATRITANAYRYAEFFNWVGELRHEPALLPVLQTTGLLEGAGLRLHDLAETVRPRLIVTPEVRQILSRVRKLPSNDEPDGDSSAAAA